MRQFKQEFEEARKNNDLAKVDELWKALCIEAEIEETSAGDGSVGAAIADKQNKQQFGEHTAYGKKF